MDGGPPDLVVWATAAVAVYGALLATYNAVLARRKERRERERETRQVTVEARLAAVGADPPFTAVVLTARCEGPRPVDLGGFKLHLEDGRDAWARPVPIAGQSLPARLDDGQEVDIFLDLNDLNELERKEGSPVVGATVHGSGRHWRTDEWPRVREE